MLGCMKLYWEGEDKSEIRKVWSGHNWKAPDDYRKFFVFYKTVKSVFPGYDENGFTIYWKDSQGDCITISTDEQLIVAMLEMEGTNQKDYSFHVKPN